MPDPLAKSFYRRFRESNTGVVRRVAPLVLSAILLLAAAGTGASLVARWYEQIATYRSPLAKFPRPGESGESLVPQTVLVVVDGLREDALTSMPTLQKLRGQGASATVQLSFAQTPAAWLALLSGAEAELSDAPLLGDEPPQGHGVSPETLFVTMRRANLNTAIAAGARWRSLVPEPTLGETYFAEDADAAIADRRVTDAAVGFLRYFSPNFLLVHLASPSDAARRGGVGGDAYRAALLHTDFLLAELTAALGRSQGVLVVTGSHGVTGGGGFAGGEAEVMQVPLVLTGARIKPGAYGTVRQSDIAPTIAALAGGSLPSASQGDVLFQLLELSEAQRAAKALALAHQQAGFGTAYLATIGGELSEHAQNDPRVAQSSFEVKNYESAFNLARLATVQVQHDVARARDTRIERERQARLAGAVALGILPPLVLWFRRSLRLGLSALIAIGIATMVHLRYLQEGHFYSFSELIAREELLRGFLERGAAALAFGALLVIILHWHDAKPSRVRTALTLCGASAMAIYLLVLPSLAAFYWQGSGASWYLGSPAVAHTFFFGLASASAIAALAPAAGIAAALVHWLALIVAHRLARLSWIRRLRQAPGALANLLH